MIRCKDSVRFSCLRSEIYGLWSGLELIFAKHDAEIWITCGTDGHTGIDPHPFGFAIDLRSHGLAEPHVVLDELREFCGPRYTVLLEGKDTANEHFHLQLRKDLWRGIVGLEE